MEPARNMALKFKYKSKEEVPAEHVPFYAEREGAWQLDVEGGVADAAALAEVRKAEKAKLDEFRENNNALKRQIEELN